MGNFYRFLLLSILLSLFVKNGSSFSASTKANMEATVRTYFQGVNQKNPAMIRSCFDETAFITDICGVNAAKRRVKASDLVQRCMDFVTAHPDCRVNFYYGPECGRTSDWVVVHWYETGNWTGTSCGIPPQNTPMTVEGQTRFHVDPQRMTIQELVVTRTFTEWEITLLEQTKPNYA